MQLNIGMDELGRATKVLPSPKEWYEEFGSRPFTVNAMTMLADIQIAKGEKPSEDDTIPYIQFVFKVEVSVRSKTNRWYQWILIDYIGLAKEK